jgi:ABC-type transport system involved in multi-copper enzyme maturation permease subunit
MNSFTILFKAEFKRFFSPAMIVAAIAVIGLGNMMSFAMISLQETQRSSALVEVSFGVSSFIAVLIFSAGIVGYDVKSGWLRTLLIRSITRQQYVLAKVAVTVSASVLTMFVSIMIPLLYYSLFTNAKIVVDWMLTVEFLILNICEMVLLIVMSTAFSCWITGAFNSLLVYIWMGATTTIEILIAKKYWDISWVMVVKDYLFPSGFQHAINALKMNAEIPYADILWGITAMMFFLSVMLFLINTVQVDTSTE